MQTLLKNSKSQYTEDEVAQELGVSLDHLRAVIRERILVNEDDVRPPADVTFQPSDVLLLKVLCAQPVCELPH